MFYLNNSETSWLVYADWLEDQDIDATHIRQEIIEPTSNTWCWEHKTCKGVGTAGAGAGVFEFGEGVRGVGSKYEIGSRVGLGEYVARVGLELGIGGGEEGVGGVNVLS